MNNDLISREALKEEIRNNKKVAGRFIEGVIMLIDNAPTVEPEKAKESEIIKAYTKGFDTGVETVKNERPQGEWITIHKQNSFGQDCICFECDKCHKYKVPIYKLMITEPLEVCPNCGAKMKGGAV